MGRHPCRALSRITNNMVRGAANRWVNPASKENILAAKRHMRDLERQGTDDFPWILMKRKGIALSGLSKRSAYRKVTTINLFYSHGSILSSAPFLDGFIKIQEFGNTVSGFCLGRTGKQRLSQVLLIICWVLTESVQCLRSG